MARALSREEPGRRPDAADAGMVLEIAEWYLRCGMPAALSWLWNQGVNGDEVVGRCAPGGIEDGTAAQICAYYDVVGALHRHGLIHDSLLFDWLTVAPVWDRMKGYVLARRRDACNQTLWSCFEEMARDHKRLIGEYAT
jgi:hypothetical protein